MERGGWSRRGKSCYCEALCTFYAIFELCSGGRHYGESVVWCVNSEIYCGRTGDFVPGREPM
jgi:hypothetical protein